MSGFGGRRLAANLAKRGERAGGAGNAEVMPADAGVRRQERVSGNRAGREGGTSRPLLNADKNFMVLWSPKSACTTVYAWFSHVSGFGDELAEFGNRIHQHRVTKFYHSELYERSAQADRASLRCLRIIRDPYARAVSIYRHALKMGFADDATRSVMGRHFASKEGYSFQQFLDFLQEIDISAANIHLRPQFHRFERTRKPDRLINITKQKLFVGLNAFEIEMGFPATNFDDLGWLHALEGPRKAKQEPMEGAAFDTMAFNRQQVRQLNQFPAYDQLLTLEAKQKIEAIYKTDFEAYRDYL